MCSKTDVVKEDVYNAKTKKIEDKIPDITNLATNNAVNAKIHEVEKEIPSITNLATTTTTDLNAKANEVKNKIPNITTNLTTTIALTAVDTKIPNVSNLFKKSDYSTKNSVKLISVKATLLLTMIIIYALLLKLTSEHFTPASAETNLSSKSDIVNFKFRKKSRF